jgi:hypothetical protein
MDGLGNSYQDIFSLALRTLEPAYSKPFENSIAPLDIWREGYSLRLLFQKIKIADSHPIPRLNFHDFKSPSSKFYICIT